MGKKMRVAQIGVANFGARRRHIMRKSGLFELVAAYDLNQEALKACQQEDGATPVASYQALLDTPDIEAVIISTGAKFHAEQMTMAMERGLHVFVEKPVCATPEELQQLLRLQQKTGVIVGVGHTDHTHDAVSLRIKSMLDSEELGKIATFEKTTAHSGGLGIQPGDWRGDPAKNPGGMLFQCGVHGLHELMHYFGPISSVYCTMRHDVHTTGTADVALCHLHFESGLIGNLNCYHVTPYRHTLSIFGTKATLYRDDRYFDEGTKLLLQCTGHSGSKEEKQPVAIDSALSDECSGMRSFYNAVREGSVCYPSLLDGLRAVAVVFAAEESFKTGRLVSCTPYQDLYKYLCTSRSMDCCCPPTRRHA